MTAVLFLGAVIGVIVGFSVPEEKQELVTHLTYDIEGAFSHQAYENPAPVKQPNPRYFTSIIDSVEVYYSYRFLPEEPVTRVTEQVVISALVVCPTWGETEVVIVPRAEKLGDFTISFPLDTAPPVRLADKISDELGAAKCSPDITFKASVHTVAQTAAGVLEDDFVQTLSVKLDATTLEWGWPLTLSEMRYANGLKYVHQGNFSYAVNLKPNILFGAVTMAPEIPPPGSPVPLKSSESYKSETIDRIEGTFAYKFNSSESLSQVVNEVEVTALLGEAGGWYETFSLAPVSQQTDDFTVDFLLDVPLFYAIIESVEKETGTAASRELTITADVHTTARSEFGAIDETFSQSLTVILGPEQVAWPEAEPTTKSGAIEETLVVSNPAAGTARIVSLGALGMMLVALLYVTWSYREFKRRRISRIEADIIEARSKQDLVVDVERLPAPVWNQETTVEVGSLSELIKTADSLLKPVLHLAEPDRHIYCVIDGVTRYRYVTPTEEPETPATQEPSPTDKNKSS